MRIEQKTKYPGFKSSTWEWNDSLTGDNLWTNTNVGEAMYKVMTPLTRTWLRHALSSRKIIPIHPAGNIGGKAYFIVSVFARMYRIMGIGEKKLLKNLEGILNVKLPGNIEITLIRLSGRKTIQPAECIQLFTQAIALLQRHDRIPP